MPDSVLTKQLRFLDVARAFQILATNPDAAFELAKKLDDSDLAASESLLHNATKTMNGDFGHLAAEIEVLLGNPATPPIPVVPAAHVAAEVVDIKLPFRWKKTGARGANPEDVRFDVKNWNGLNLTITKHGAADYEAFINDAPFMRGKFKKNVREKVEKEAVKRVS